VTIRKEKRGDQLRLIIDIPYRTADGKRERYRRDAQVQTRASAESEHRRLLVELERTGTLAKVNEPPEAEKLPATTFADAVKHFRAIHMKTALKPSTRVGYQHRIDTLFLPRFAALPLDTIDGNALGKLDAELVADGLMPSTRAKIHTVLRSILNAAVRAGMLPRMPALPRMPKVGRKIPRPMRRDTLDTILNAANPSARLAFALAAFAGLRASEVRGLRWPDIDLDVGTLTVRRAITFGIETTPKSHSQRLIPIGRALRTELEKVKRPKNKPWAPVALTAHGKPWGESGLNQSFKRVMERTKLSGWSFHDLRHFFVTELFRQRANAAAIRQLAGHADLATTQRYADLDANDLRSAIDLIDGNGVETGKTDNTAVR